MQITYKGDYSLKAMLDLSLHYGKDVITIHGMAKRIDAPAKFLEQVLLDLKKGGFVESKRGVKGGYFLAKPPDKIVLGDVVRFVEGPVEPVPCADVKSHYKGCRDIHKCVFRGIWIDVAKATHDIIDNITFRDLADKFKTTIHSGDFYTI